MLRPLIFKNNDDLAGQPTKIGKVSSELARLIYSFTLSDKVGILKGYANECSIKQAVVGGLGNTTITFNKGALSIYGGIILIEQDTTLSVPNVTNGSIGVLVDLNQEAGNEVSFYAGTSPSSRRDNLQDNEADGIYYFELYTYSVSGSQFTQLGKTSEYINANQQLTQILDGELAVPKANQVVPSATTDNSVSFYVGENLVKLEW